MNVQTAINNKRKEKLFVSLALKPGTTGTKFYTRLFEMYNIDAEYVACECVDLASDISLIREHCAGASVTMPYKQKVADYLDANYSAYTPINTVLNSGNFLVGYNCDIMGMHDLFANEIKNKSVNILGSGAMSQNAKIICGDKSDFCKVYSRKYGNWLMRNTSYDVLINTTSVGMDGVSCPVQLINSELVVDCVIGNTPLIQKAIKDGVRVITGNEIYIAQLRHQFRVYTGISVNMDTLKNIAKEVW